MTQLRAVSLFSNCGAGDLGYHQAGFSFDVLAELEAERLAVAALNNRGAATVLGDLRETWPEVVGHFLVRRGNGVPPALLAACPPCQGMSTARGGRGRDDDAEAGGRDARNLLVVPIAKVARQLRPRAIVVENVTAFLSRKVPHPKTGEPITAAHLLISELKDAYEVFPIVVDLAEYGIPQTRKRCFLTFIARREPAVERLQAAGRVPYPAPTHAADHGGASPVTLAKALDGFGLPSLDAASIEVAAPQGVPVLHQVPVWSEQHYAMVAAIPERSGRSAWENDTCPKCGVVAGSEHATCEVCHSPLLRPIVYEDGKHRLIRGFRNSSYKRMAPHQPAATITTASGRIGSDNTLHPWENRVLSILECQLLQTIPLEFQWGPELLERAPARIREMVGEAVPPSFTKLHGLAIRAALEGETLENLLNTDDSRCVRARKKLRCG